MWVGLSLKNLLNNKIILTSIYELQNEIKKSEKKINKVKRNA